jgi:large subunit ribosomal protein L18
MYAQIIDDTVGHTLVAASTVEKDVRSELEKTNNVDAASYLGTVIAKRAIEKGIDTVVFDRGGYLYHGKVAALAEAAREAGLKF